MSWAPVKDIKLRKWTILHDLAYGRWGQKLRVHRLRSQSLDLLGQAQELQSLTDGQLAERARQLRTALLGKEGTALDQAFPTILEAIRRQTTLVLHPNQVMAALAMTRGLMIELATGEGKTLVTVLASAALGLAGRRVHVFTANRYLAKRDGQCAASIVARLGLRATFLEEGMAPDKRRAAHRHDLVYATLAEIAFDWLRDRLAMRQRGARTLIPSLDAAVVDEADMVMIDEARTPMILAELTDHNEGDVYRWAAAVVAQMRPVDDYTTREQGPIELTAAARRFFRGMDETQVLVAKNAILQTLRANLYFRKNIQYVVQRTQGEHGPQDKVVLVDEKTGRLMPSRRWPDGLYEAVSVREGICPEASQHSIAQVTVQQYMAQYNSLCGCSGTMAEAAVEMYCIYALRTLRIPTHRPCIRRDLPPVVYATRPSQFQAVADQVQEMRRRGRPVLVGTTHIATSERLSAMLRQRGIEHDMLTAMEEEREAQVVAAAGRAGAVTIATNMAGRGTDIKIAPQVAAAGGLHVISLQRHASARVDRQLVGRCARQGDPGSSQFVLSLQDPLLRPLAGRLRRRYLTPDSRNGASIGGARLDRLWRAQQRRCEFEHLQTRIALIRREASLQALYGKPDYLSDYPAPQPALSA